MNPVIDINKMVSSVYDTVMKLLKGAEQMVGLDTLWCRAVPLLDSEDVIVQEYTLSNVECPRELKVITEKTDYNVGSYNVDLWGISFEAPLEICINIPTWESIYGTGTAPLKGDIVYIKMFHRLYEVATSTIQYTLTTLPSAYKCALRKYQRAASRKEAEEVRISIDELTNAQDTLFGDVISNEVADAVVERETSYNQSTTVDPIRTCDLKSIITDDVLGNGDNLISSAYYDFIDTETDVVIKGIEAAYGRDTDQINTHWIYSVWFRIQPVREDDSDNKSIQSEEIIRPVQIKNLYHKDKNYYQFLINTGSDFNAGDNVILYRGNLITLSGKLEYTECGDDLLLSIPTSDVLITNKKANKWWETLKQGWKLKKTVTIKSDTDNTVHTEQLYNLLSGYNGDNKIIDITYNGSQLKLKFNNITKHISLSNLMSNKWCYMLCDINYTNIDIIFVEVNTDDITNKRSDKVIFKKTYKSTNIKDFTIDSFKFENSGQDLNMCNMRLYESEYAMGESYKIDMYSVLTQNASKLIFIDNPLPANQQDFVAPLR